MQITGKFCKDQLSDSRDHGWDQSMASVDGNGDPETWWEPITGKVMLAPLCVTSQFQAVRSGDYARLLKANLTFDNSAEWDDNDYSNAGGISVKLKDANQRLEIATTAITYGSNRAFFFAPKFFSTGNDPRGYFECAFDGFGTGVEFRFYAAGRAEVRKAGEVVGTYTWTAPDQQGTGQKVDGKRVTFMIFPMPAAQVVVVTNEGGGFQHVFDDLDPQNQDNEVTPEGYVSFRCGDMATDVELAPIKFQTSGDYYSVLSYFKDAPESIATAEFTSIKAGSGLTSALSLEGSGNAYRIKGSLAGDGDSTYYVGAVTAEIPAEIGETPDEEYDVTDFVLSGATLSVGMAPGSAELRFTLKGGRQVPVDEEDPSLGTELEELDPGDERSIREMENRPVKLMLGDVVVLDGIAGPPGFDQGVTRENDRIHFVVKDKVCALLEEYRFSDPTALDAFSLKEALEIPLEAAGNGVNEYQVDEDAETVTMEIGALYSMGDWALQAMPRHTGMRLLQDVYDQYIADWFMNTITTELGPVFKILSLATMGEAAILKIYNDVETAAGDVEEGIDPLDRVYRTYNRKLLPIETNQMFVHGLDPVARRPLIGKWEDLPSQDITLGYAEKPENHCGTIRKSAINAPGLRSTTAITNCGEKIWRKVSWRRTIAEWDCQLLLDPDGLFPLFPGHCIEVVPHGIFRIQSLLLELDTEIQPAEGEDPIKNRLERKTHYVGELIQDRNDSKGLGHIRQRATTISGILFESLQRLKKGVFDIENELKPIKERFNGQE